MRFHAVMIDETGCEFGVTLDAVDREMAYEKLWHNYPESWVYQLESDADTLERERAMYARLADEWY